MLAHLLAFLFVFQQKIKKKLNTSGQLISGQAKVREQEIELQKRNAVLADLEIKLREQEALQRIEFQKSMGGAAVERARNLNQAEYDQE